ncbi:MAG: KUP/HAK/KT family potassium transporter [Planctomycetota bacterium]
MIALTALVAERGGKLGKHLVLVGLFAAALLYRDGMITPAISVLSRRSRRRGDRGPRLQGLRAPDHGGIWSGCSLSGARGPPGSGPCSAR